MIQYGIVCAQNGEHRETSDKKQALNLWENSPMSNGTWRLVVNWEVIKEKEVYED